jgi:hypothetical protein
MSKEIVKPKQKSRARMPLRREASVTAARECGIRVYGKTAKFMMV